MLRRSLPDSVLARGAVENDAALLANGPCLRYAVGVWKMRGREVGRSGCRDPASRRRGRKHCWAWLSVSASSSTPLPFGAIPRLVQGGGDAGNGDCHQIILQAGRACWFIICVVKLMLRWWSKRVNFFSFSIVNFATENNCSKHGRKYRLSKRDILCRSKEQGGRGIMNLKVQNKCLLSKWLFKFTNEDGIWQQIFRNKYLKSKTLTHVEKKIR